MLGGIRIAATHEDRDPAARVSSAGRPPLAPIDDIGIAVPDDGRPNVRRVRARHLGLGHGEAAPNPAIEQRLEPRALLFRSAVSLEDFHVARVGRRAIEYLGCQRRAAHHLAEGGVLQIREPRASRGIRQEETPEFRRPRLDLQVLHDLRRLPRVLANLLPPDRLVRVDVLVHEGFQLCADCRGAFRNSEGTHEPTLRCLQTSSGGHGVRPAWILRVRFPCALMCRRDCSAAHPAACRVDPRIPRSARRFVVTSLAGYSTGRRLCNAEPWGPRATSRRTLASGYLGGYPQSARATTLPVVRPRSRA